MKEYILKNRKCLVHHLIALGILFVGFILSRYVLEKTDLVELWHVWLMDYYEYEDSPVIHKRTISIGEMTIRDIYELDKADIWNSPDKNIPSRPSFYRLIITR